MILERGRGDLFGQVGVESGAIGEGEDFAGPGILHDDGCGLGLRVDDGLIDFLLGDVLDFFVDGEHQVGAGVGLAFDASEPLPAGILGDLERAGIASQLVVEGDFDARQSFVIESDIADGLGGEFALGIKALGLFLEADSAQVEVADAIGGFGVDFARDPGEILLRFHSRQDFRGVGVQHAGENGSGRRLVGDFGGNGINGVDQHRHRQFLAIAIINNAALGRDLDLALLLALGALHIGVALKDLQISEPAADGKYPDCEQTTKPPQARFAAAAGEHCRQRVHGQRVPPRADSEFAYPELSPPDSAPGMLHGYTFRDTGPSASLRKRYDGYGHAGHDRAAAQGGSVHCLDLTGLRGLQTHGLGKHVDSFGIAQRCLFEFQRAVGFIQVVALRAQLFNLVSIVDGAEMLAQVDHDERQQHGEDDGENLHLAATARVGNLHQPRVVDCLGKIDFRRARHISAGRRSSGFFRHRRQCCSPNRH